MTSHKVGTREEWREARNALLEREKELTRRNDELARERRELPWVAIEKDYEFDTDEGKKSLAELFDGRSQLLVYNFMFGPEYEAGCPVCSSSADGFDAWVPHLGERDRLQLRPGSVGAQGGVDAVPGGRHPTDRVAARGRVRNRSGRLRHRGPRLQRVRARRRSRLQHLRNDGAR